ncbi:radical SAM protein, partial [Roseiarcus sp.]|uniref:radical SAM protein n=1 Tax=Roseiarcus sp. TaxID=1969460 RepID=UPI003F96C204
MMMSPHITLIVKLTNACNMQCHYCFIEPWVFHNKMKPETARLVIRSFLDSNYFQSVDFVWHGGEPLLRGRKFFEMLIGEQKSRPTRVSYTNSIQTNATELSDDMVDFLTANQFQIGLSLDGPTTLTDEARRMRSKVDRRSAYEVTVDAAKRLQQRGGGAGAIVVVNRNNVNEPEAIYRDFSERRIHM